MPFKAMLSKITKSKTKKGKKPSKIKQFFLIININLLEQILGPFPQPAEAQAVGFKLS